MTAKYRDYFNIDPEYFPQATEELINSGKVDWKKFYPHETFVKLIKDTINVLNRQPKQSLWVEGAYGTGKSHAVLTLQKLIDASSSEVAEYFSNYKFLPNDLCNKLQGIKKQGKILTVRRYGSSSVNNDNDLIFCMQESIMESLQKNGIEHIGSSSLRGSIIKWMSDEANRTFFNSVISREKYAGIFEGDTADSVLEKLKTYSEKSLISLMNRIYKISDELPRSVFRFDMDSLVVWIKEVISKNSLKAIFFIWDEFTEYFQNNKHHLTEFQKLIEISETNPFLLCIVTHKSSALFNDNDDDKTKILGRFVSPTCNIELPENMAFRLMGQAMEKNEDEHIRAEWNEAADDLNERLHECRSRVIKSAKITEDELKNILPIHPYTALLLKHISSAFDSNQRSMFDFIKNDRGDEVKGFQWFIDNYGPEDDEPLLTVDLLWDFFYEKGKNNLDPSIKTILDSYSRQNTSLLKEEEKRVLKAILLLQAISQKVGDSVEIFIPDIKNINYAYEGTEIDNGRAGSIADKLCREEILYKKPMGLGKFQYSAMINAGDSEAIEKNKADLKKTKKTRDFVNEGEFNNFLGLSSAFSLRYEFEFATIDNFKSKINELRNKEKRYSNKILAIVTFAKDDSESAAISKSIRAAIKDDSFKMLFIDTSTTPLGYNAIEQYIDNIANSMYQRKADGALAKQYEDLAKTELVRWKERIISGEFFIYSNEQRAGQRISNIDELRSQLYFIDKKQYPYGIEHIKVIDNLFTMSSLKLGAECGSNENTKGTYRSSNPVTKLENVLSGAWGVEQYWKNPDSTFQNNQVKRIKLQVEKSVSEAFSQSGKISISDIYEELKVKPFGLMPCNFTAFILGFVLKEYANDTYRWTDNQTSDYMSSDKLKEMIDEIIKLQYAPNPKYRDKYIVTMTLEEKSFSSVSSEVFKIPLSQCTSIQHTRDLIRNRMKQLDFPLWCLKSITSELSLESSVGIVNELIDNYCGIANTNNVTGLKSENDLALSIGKTCLDYPSVVNDFKALISSDNCRKGMTSYLNQYKNGEVLDAAEKIGCRKAVLSDIKEKFDADAANWVWSIDTANRKIDEVVIEYKTINLSNKLTSKSSDYRSMIQTWCDKLGVIKVAYEAVKLHCDDIKPLLEILVLIKKTGEIQDSRKGEFLSLLNLKSEELKKFFANQLNLFKEVSSTILYGLSNDEINEIWKNLKSGTFTYDKAEYITYVNSTVDDYKNSQEKRKLKKLWKEKTGSSTPREWSIKNRTPILCMVPDKDVVIARMAFATINRTNPEKEEIRKAVEYFENASFFEILNDSDKLNELFMKGVVRNYVTILTDPHEVRNHLDERLGAEPYDWYGSIEVDNLVRSFAELKYDMGGSEKALDVIENMDESTVKKYLKQLIKDNIAVGIEIIRDN